MKKKLAELLLQIIPVMIGVYLGFVVSKWSEYRDRKQQSEQFTTNLISEIEANQKRLESVVAYHEMLRDSSRFYSNKENKLSSPRFFEGTRLTKLVNSAYETGIQTGVINELSIDEIQSINKLYTFQSDYNDFGKMMMASLINKDFSDNEGDMRKIARFLSVTMTDVVIKEKDLIDGYKLLTKKLLE